MPLSIYVAAPWSYKDTAAKVADYLKAAGYDIACDWMYDPPAPDTVDHDDTALAAHAQRDFDGVKNCDVLLLLNLQRRGEETSGKAVETGIALALNKPIIMIGEVTNIFQLLPSVARTMEDQLSVLEELKKHANQ